MDILEKRSALSFEVSPPKTDVGMERLCGEGGVLEQLYVLSPGYISCDPGAGGQNVGRDLEVLDKIVRDGRTTGVTFIPCAGSTREGIRAQLRNYLEHGVDHMLALDGGLPYGRSAAGGLKNAAQLVRFVREMFGCRYTIAVSASPEGLSPEEERISLKQAQDSGADYILTQPGWDMDRFRRWLDGIRAAGIWLPVDVGVLPILDQAETIAMALSRSGRVMPKELSGLISRNWIYPDPFARDPFDAGAEEKKASFKAAGMDYTVGQIGSYRACGVRGIHLHTGADVKAVAQIARDAGLADGAPEDQAVSPEGN